MTAIAKLRGTVLFLYYLTSCVATYLSTVAGYPLWLFSSNLARAWMASGKRMFASIQVAVLQVFTNSQIKLYVDPQIRDQFSIEEKTGHLRTNLSPRSIIISNHQLYSDWVYIWWLAYTSNLSDAIKILLKDSLKRIPIFGWGMQHFEFIFLKRKWAEDEATIAKHMSDLSHEPNLPAMVVLFPEGTTMSTGGYSRNHAYAEKNGIKEFNHLLLPRARGLQAILKGGCLPYLYDLTFYYAGIPEGTYGEEFYTLARTYAGGQSPPEIKIHIRRFETKDILYDNDAALAEWLNKVWSEKDKIFEQLKLNTIAEEPLKTTVRLDSVLEVLEPFNVPLMAYLGTKLIRKWLN